MDLILIIYDLIFFQTGAAAVTLNQRYNYQQGYFRVEDQFPFSEDPNPIQFVLDNKEYFSCEIFCSLDFIMVVLRSSNIQVSLILNPKPEVKVIIYRRFMIMAGNPAENLIKTDTKSVIHMFIVST